jgi:hypothetical protein
VELTAGGGKSEFDDLVNERVNEWVDEPFDELVDVRVKRI